MQTHSRRVLPPQPRVFNYSLDWRFLLPIEDVTKVLVAFEDDPDFSQTLEHIGITVSNQLAFSDIQKKKKNNAYSFVLPFGLPMGWVGAQDAAQIEFYHTIRSWIDQRGCVLVGFNNAWNFRSGARFKYHSSTPRRVVDQLHKAGFASVKLVGAIPNLRIPEYTFDLDSPAMLFALRHRYKRKPTVLTSLQVIVRIIGLAPISNLLPCYFALATV